MPRSKAPAEPEATISTETDESLVAAAERAFEGMLEEPPDLSDIPPVGLDFSRSLKPGIDKMVTVRGGGLYLPVRARVGWMRGEPVRHPDWTIDTYPEKVVEGDFKSNKVVGGYARYRANVYDETGRLIATGTKTEYSERFTDFVEKAETGSIGRALAVAGYGTEAAVDLDEGYEQDRIADAPVTPGGRPINITASAIPGVRAGGRPEKVEITQIREIGRLNRALGLGYGLVTVLDAVKGEKMPPLVNGEEAKQIEEYLRTFTHEQAGLVIQELTKALRDEQAEAQAIET